MKSDPNFEEKWHDTFDEKSEKSKNLHFDGIFLSQVCNVWAKIIQTICVLKKDLWFKERHKKFGAFHTSSWK